MGILSRIRHRLSPRGPLVDTSPSRLGDSALFGAVGAVAAPGDPASVEGFLGGALLHRSALAAAYDEQRRLQERLIDTTASEK